MENSKPKIVFLGSPDFALPALQHMTSRGYKPDVVITQPDKPVGRKQVMTSPPVKAVAEELGIIVFQPKTKKTLNQIFQDFNFDLGVLVAYGMIIPDETLERPRKGIINIHPSLLPKYRGPSPIQAALLAGDEETGVSIIKLVSKMDAGPILAQKSLLIDPSDTAVTLSTRLAELGAKMLDELLHGYLNDEVSPVFQDEAFVSYCTRIQREDGAVDWFQPAEYIMRKWRAYQPWPGLYTVWDSLRLKLLEVAIVEPEHVDPRYEPGTVYRGKSMDEIYVKCGRGALALLAVQLEGKNKMTATELATGHPGFVSSVLR